jgi:hypothetical protein
MLIGHLGATAFVFVSLFTLGWCASFVFHYLNAVHHFPEEIFTLLTRFEIGLVYVDTAVSGIVLLTGILRYIRDVLENDS